MPLRVFNIVSNPIRESQNIITCGVLTKKECFKPYKGKSKFVMKELPNEINKCFKPYKGKSKWCDNCLANEHEMFQTL